MKLNYKKLSFNDFLTSYQASVISADLFELTPAWLDTTNEFMLTEQENVVVHCLCDKSDSKQDKLVVAWPLVHQSISKHQKTICSLTSFYSAVTSPFFMVATESVKGADIAYYHLSILLDGIKKNNVWHQMQLGPFEDNLSQPIAAHFNCVRHFSKSDNWYVNNIINFDSYYQQRPSKLKNTIKRKKKKLAADHHYHSKIIIEPAEFQHFFSDYQRIYRLSWKGDEYSFEFIKHVCLQAAAQNKLRMGILFVDDQAVAMQLWFLQNNTASIFKLAYDPDYKAYSVGSILSMALSEHVIEYDKVTCIEFGMGSEPYKKDWMDKKQERVTLQVFNEQTFFGLLGAAKHIIPSKLKSYLRKNKGQSCHCKKK